MLAERRPSAVAGTFYPADPAELARIVDQYLDLPQRDEAPRPMRRAKAVVVPHAGYIYSGPIAGHGFAALRGGPELARVERVVLIGPAHRVPVRGLVSPGVRFLETPLGDVEVDLAALALVPQVGASAYAHAMEHSLEVELPFLVRLFPHARVVPLAAGDATSEEVARILDALWGGPETVIVISSDLSHYLPYARAKAMDADTLAHVVAFDAGAINHERACGATGLSGLLHLAKGKGLTARVLDARSSGDTAGDKARVVGYAAIGFYEPPAKAPAGSAQTGGLAS